MPNILIQTDSRSRAVLPGQKNKQFIMQENEDGSILLQPAVVVNQAQFEYDNDPQLRAMLDRAMASGGAPRKLPEAK